MAVRLDRRCSLVLTRKRNPQAPCRIPHRSLAAANKRAKSLCIAWRIASGQQQCALRHQELQVLRRRVYIQVLVFLDFWSEQVAVWECAAGGIGCASVVAAAALCWGEDAPSQVSWDTGKDFGWSESLRNDPSKVASVVPFVLFFYLEHVYNTQLVIFAWVQQAFLCLWRWHVYPASIVT